jgi:hypothetical protein
MRRLSRLARISIAEALALLDTKDAAIVTYAQTHDLPEPQEIES